MTDLRQAIWLFADLAAHQTQEIGYVISDGPYSWIPVGSHAGHMWCAETLPNGGITRAPRERLLWQALPLVCSPPSVQEAFAREGGAKLAAAIKREVRAAHGVEGLDLATALAGAWITRANLDIDTGAWR